MEECEVTNEHIVNLLRDISGKLDKALAGENVGSPANAFSSSSLDELFSALAQAQAEMPFAMRYKENPYYAELFEDLPSLIEASRPSLTKYGLSVIHQLLPNKDGQSFLHTIFAHKSGQWIKSVQRFTPPKDDIQTEKSYLDALKRNSYSAITGVVSYMDDDDGEKSMETAREERMKGTSLSYLKNKKPKFKDTISTDELRQIKDEIGEFTEIGQEILDKKKIQSLADIPKEQFDHTITMIRRIANYRRGN